MTITVQYQPSTWVLNENWLFECQHDTSHVEEIDFGRADSYLCDYVDNWRVVDVCDDCDAILDREDRYDDD